MTEQGPKDWNGTFGPRPRAGRDFGPYRLIEKLGDGGFAEIFVARHVEQGRDCVLKLLHEHLHQHKVTLDMFLTEAKVMMALEHPTIVRFFDLNQERGRWYIDMEWVEGADLAEVFDLAQDHQVSMPVYAAVDLIRAVASAVDHAHDRKDPTSGASIQIIHRDLKPDNLLLTWDGAVKVTDFGCAKAVGIQEELTRPGIRKGTLDYMSPEQCLGRQVDHRTDVFSLGVVLYELVTMSRLFADDSDARVIDRIVHENVTPPSYLNDEVNAALDLIILRALEKRADDRFKSASEFQRALSWWLVRYPPEPGKQLLADWLKTHIRHELGRFRALENDSTADPQRGALVLRRSSRSSRNRSSRRSDAVNAELAQGARLLARSNLPGGPEELWGRDELSEQLYASVEHGNQLVSVYGRAGHGKTALMLWLGHAMLEGAGAWPGGVWWVDLSELTNIDALPELLAETLKLPHVQGAAQIEELREAFAIRGATLLLLDGADHVVAGLGEMLSQWTHTCEDLAFVITSAEEIRQDDVRSVGVGALYVPNDPRKLAKSPAGAFFSALVARKRPGFSLQPRHLQVLHEYLTELRGSPAAIEDLARRLLETDIEAELIGDEGPVLSGVGIDQDTLEVAIELTWNELNDNERAVLAVSSAFHGGVGYEALETVLTNFLSPNRVSDAIESLSERLLLRYQFPNDARVVPRYWLADSIRRRARTTLADSGRRNAVNRLHVNYFVGQSASLAQLCATQYGDSAVMQMRDELLNIEAALNRVIHKVPVSEGRATIACELLNNLWVYADIRAKYATFVDLGVRVREVLRLDAVQSRPACQFLLNLSAAALAVGQDALAQQCIEDAQSLGVDNVGLEMWGALAQQSAELCLSLGQLDNAEAFVEVAQNTLEDQRPTACGAAYRLLADIQMAGHRHEEAITSAESGIQSVAAEGSTHRLARLQFTQARALLRSERMAAAERCLLAAQEVFERFWDRDRLARTLVALAQIYHRRDDNRAFQQAVKEAEQLAEQHGDASLKKRVMERLRVLKVQQTSAERRVSLTADVLEDSFAVAIKSIEAVDES
ncbi:MAG TPA: hypothetical protein DCQ06_09445 [Myxococcales bacterium]|nr:hypothetical protein [Myxococcales bacterium]HAN31807.1 hypothetical protein [Myxococcales bacterium]